MAIYRNRKRTPVILVGRGFDIDRVRKYLPTCDVFTESEARPLYRKSEIYLCSDRRYLKKYPNSWLLEDIFKPEGTRIPSTELQTIHDICDEIYSALLSRKWLWSADRDRYCNMDIIHLRPKNTPPQCVLLGKESHLVYVTREPGCKPPKKFKFIYGNKLVSPMTLLKRIERVLEVK